MRLALNPRARRLLRSVPRTTVYTVAELLLLSLLAIQCARLFWTFVTPVDPVGEWQSAASKPVAPVSTALLGSFDPFFRLSGGGTPVVTSLNLKLYGVRENRASGRGSAIIAAPDGLQKSFAVGEEVMPGVTLVAVTFDSVTLDRGGTREQLYLDQSPTATIVAPGAAPSPAIAPPPTAPPPVVTVPAVQMPLAAPSPGTTIMGREVRYEPRMDKGRVTGVILNPDGSGQAFRDAGLRPNDVLVSINGQPINSPGQIQAIARQFSAGDTNVVVERAGEPVTLRVRAPR